jgi:hypothetical protein
MERYGVFITSTDTPKAAGALPFIAEPRLFPGPYMRPGLFLSTSWTRTQTLGRLLFHQNHALHFHARAVLQAVEIESVWKSASVKPHGVDDPRGRDAIK